MRRFQNGRELTLLVSDDHRPQPHILTFLHPRYFCARGTCPTNPTQVALLTRSGHIMTFSLKHSWTGNRACSNVSKARQTSQSYAHAHAHTCTRTHPPTHSRKALQIPCCHPESGGWNSAPSLCGKPSPSPLLRCKLPSCLFSKNVLFFSCRETAIRLHPIICTCSAFAIREQHFAC